jgi:hypothetical protein
MSKILLHCSCFRVINFSLCARLGKVVMDKLWPLEYQSCCCLNQAKKKKEKEKKKKRKKKRKERKG